jgi:capsular exopolysaccharide synthesis family protein
MSRIFDALQRSEKERPGSDGVALPEGAELLQRAERYATSKWNADAALNGSPTNALSDGNLIREAEVALADLPIDLGSSHLEDLSFDERRDVFSRFKSLPIALPAQSRLVCLTDRESPTAEALRLLGVRLRDLRRIKPLKKVLITSTIPQEGKSTIASNLACALSRATEERVLLVEGDLRRPTLSKLFGLHSNTGICSCIHDHQSPLETIYDLKDAGLWIWPAGHSPGSPLEVLQSARLPVIMNHLAAHFDWIIIDSPPVLPLADTSIWMRLADGILLVTRQGVTEKKQLQKGLESLDPKKMLGALLNGATVSAYSGYYYDSSSRTS